MKFMLEPIYAAKRNLKFMSTHTSVLNIKSDHKSSEEQIGFELYDCSAH